MVFFKKKGVRNILYVYLPKSFLDVLRFDTSKNCLFFIIRKTFFCKLTLVEYTPYFTVIYYHNV